MQQSEVIYTALVSPHFTRHDYCFGTSPAFPLRFFSDLFICFTAAPSPVSGLTKYMPYYSVYACVRHLCAHFPCTKRRVFFQTNAAPLRLAPLLFHVFLRSSPLSQLSRAERTDRNLINVRRLLRAASLWARFICCQCRGGGRRISASLGVTCVRGAELCFSAC